MPFNLFTLSTKQDHFMNKKLTLKGLEKTRSQADDFWQQSGCRRNPDYDFEALCDGVMVNMHAHRAGNKKVVLVVGSKGLY